MRRILIAAVAVVVCASPALGRGLALSDWIMRGDTLAASTSPPPQQRIRMNIAAWCDVIPAPAILAVDSGTFRALELAWNRRPFWSNAILEGLADSAGRQVWIAVDTPITSIPAEEILRMLRAESADLATLMNVSRKSDTSTWGALRDYAAALGRIRHDVAAGALPKVPDVAALTLAASSCDAPLEARSRIGHLAALGRLLRGIAGHETRTITTTIKELEELPAPDAEVMHDLGILRYATGDWRGAQTALGTALRGRFDLETLFTYAMAARHAGDLETAAVAVAALRLRVEIEIADPVGRIIWTTRLNTVDRGR